MTFLKYPGLSLFNSFRPIPLYVLLVSLVVLEVPHKVESSTHFTPSPILAQPFQLYTYGELIPHLINGPTREISPARPADLVSIAQLLAAPSQYHMNTVKVRGTVTQPELHIDETGLFIRFVFVLKEAEHTLVVFGHHDRTRGNIQIETDEKVEVIGIFWKDRTANDHHFQNNLEAISVTKYPPLHPDAT